MIALELCKIHFENLLIIYLRFRTKKCRDKNCKYECQIKGLKNNKFSYICSEYKKPS